MIWFSKHDDETATSRDDRSGEPAVRILRTGEEISESMRRAARSEQRVRRQLTHQYGHYYGVATWNGGSRDERADRLSGGRSGPEGSASPWREDVRLLEPGTTAEDTGRR